MSRTLLALLLLSSMGRVVAQQVVVAPLPSGSASLAVTLSNQGSFTLAQPELFTEALAGITLSASPPCEVSQSGQWVRLFTVQLEPGASIACTLTYARDATSPIPTRSVAFGGGNGIHGFVIEPADWTVGSIADLSIRVAQVHPLPLPGATEALFRVSLSNPSDQGVDGAGFGHCSHFGLPPVLIDVDIPGGCATPDGGINCSGAVSFAALLPPAPAHGESSCLIRTTFPPGLVGGESFDLRLDSSRTRSSAGYVILDPDVQNDSVELVIGLLVNHSIPASGRRALVALAAVLMLSGAALLASSRSFQRR